MEINDLQKAAGLINDEEFVLEIVFFKTNITIDELSTRNFVLNVAPVVNLFTQDAEPINLTHEVPEYLVIPSGAQRADYQIYSIDSVSGYVQGQSGAKNLHTVLSAWPVGRALASQLPYGDSAVYGQRYDRYLSVGDLPGRCGA